MYKEFWTIVSGEVDLPMRLIAVALLFVSSLFAQYNNVFVAVSAPKDWQEGIREGLTTKLNAIPDVQVVTKQNDAAFTVDVDVNAVTRGQNDEIIGYSLMALIYGTYDRDVLTLIFNRIWGDSKDPAVQQYLQFLRYTASGNIFLAGTVHTHGPTDNISDAYDLIVSKLKTSALPELRRWRQMVNDLPEIKPAKPVPGAEF